MNPTQPTTATPTDTKQLTDTNKNKNANADQPVSLLAVNIDDVQLASLVDRRSKAHAGTWDKAPYDLKKTREHNQELYSTEYIKKWSIDERFEEVVADNRMFTSVRTIVPFVTGQITQPEVIASSGEDINRQFAQDFERILAMHAEDQQAKAKVKVAVQDNLRGQRVGILKWRYDAGRDTVVLEHIDPDSVIVDSKARLHEEPRFLQHTQERTIGQLIKQFPAKKQVIIDLFKVDSTDLNSLDDEKQITETWLYVDEDDKDTLIVVWKFENTVLGKSKDPNWMWGADASNLLDNPMIPFIFFNTLNDGSSLIDQTSFMEQAQYLQNNYDKRSMAIAANAKFGGIGVPVFAKGALPQADAAKIEFSPLQRILLDTEDVSKAFTTWQAGSLQSFVVEDKYDSRNSIDNIFGTPNILRGEQSKNNTLGQDVIIRDQAEGRQNEIIDAIDNAMMRFYQILAQMIYRYFDEDHYYKFMGEDGAFVRIIINQAKIAKNIGIAIKVKAGSSLPVDKSQKRAIALKLAQLNRIGTLRLYEELGVERPEDAYKQYLMELKDPASALGHVNKDQFSREAEEDLQMVMAGEVPDERDDLPNEYIAYLNEYLLTDKWRLLQDEDPTAAANVSIFIDGVIGKVNRKIAKLQEQEPVPQAGQPKPPADAPIDPNAPPVDPNAAVQPPAAAPAATPAMPDVSQLQSLSAPGA